MGRWVRATPQGLCSPSLNSRKHPQKTASHQGSQKPRNHGGCLSLRAEFPQALWVTLGGTCSGCHLLGMDTPRPRSLTKGSSKTAGKPLQNDPNSEQVSCKYIPNKHMVPKAVRLPHGAPSNRISNPAWVDPNKQYFLFDHEADLPRKRAYPNLRSDI